MDNSCERKTQIFGDWISLCTHRYIIPNGECTHGGLSPLCTAATPNSHSQGTCPIMLEALNCYTATIYNSYKGNAQTLVDWRPLCTHYTTAYGKCTYGCLSLLCRIAIYISYCQGTFPIITEAISNYTVAISNSYVGNAQTLVGWRPLCTHCIIADGECTHGGLSLLCTAATSNLQPQGKFPIIVEALQIWLLVSALYKCYIHLVLPRHSSYHYIAAIYSSYVRNCTSYIQHIWKMHTWRPVPALYIC